MTDLDARARPWVDALLRETGPLEFYDAHTHIGQNDPDGYRQRPDELLAARNKEARNKRSLPGAGCC